MYEILPGAVQGGRNQYAQTVQQAIKPHPFKLLNSSYQTFNNSKMIFMACLGSLLVSSSSIFCSTSQVATTVSVRTGNCVGVSFPKAPLGMQPESVTETGVAEIFLVNLHGSLFFLNEC
jgi:hypothetical protein